MARSTIHISVPEATRRYVESRVSAAGYGSVSEYLRELIRKDRLLQIRIAAREKEEDSDDSDDFGRYVERPRFLPLR